MDFNRRGFFSPLVLAPAAVAVAVVPEDEMQLSESKEKIVCCWSGWRLATDNNRLSAWYTVHLPFDAAHPSHAGLPQWQRVYRHFVSTVQSSRSYELVQVGGYHPGACFNSCNAILLEESDIALRARRGGKDFDAVMDEVFFKEKKRALDALVRYVGELERV